MIYLEFVLYPIIFPMKWILELGHFLFSSYGVAIIFLSIVVSTVTYPLSVLAGKIREKEADIRNAMEPRIKEAKVKYKGEKRFLKIAKIYAEHGYHPIHSLRSIGGIALQIPFLLSALLLLWNYSPLTDTPFLILQDLSRPDGLVSLPSALTIGKLNVLPFMMMAFSTIESFVQKYLDISSRVKVWIISIVLFFLVYSLPSSVLLYWTINSFLSLLRACFKSTSKKNPCPQA